MPKSRPRAEPEPRSPGYVCGARPTVHAAYLAALVAVALMAGGGVPLGRGGSLGGDGDGEGGEGGWGGAAGSVGVNQTQCPTRTRTRPGGGGTIRTIDPRCFGSPSLDVHIWDTGLSPKLCRTLIKYAEAAGAKQGWGETSHLGVKTYDMYIDKLGLPREDALEVNAFLKRMRGFIRQNFVVSHTATVSVTILLSDPDCWQQVERPELDGAINGLWKQEAYGEVVQLKNLPFVIRYEAEGDHAGLMWHKDNADVSFIVLLSDLDEFEVEGGGHAATRFEAFGDVELAQVTTRPPAQRPHFRYASACVADRPWKAAIVRVSHSLMAGWFAQGQAVVMSGQLVHAANHLASGKRYVLSGFTYFDAKYLDMKRRDTLATLAYLH